VARRLTCPNRVHVPSRCVRLPVGPEPGGGPCAAGTRRAAELVTMRTLFWRGARGAKRRPATISWLPFRSTCNVCTPVCYKNTFPGKCIYDRNFAAVFLQVFIDFALVSFMCPTLHVLHAVSKLLLVRQHI
jgi:hypothetical protein